VENFGGGGGRALKRGDTSAIRPIITAALIVPPSNFRSSVVLRWKHVSAEAMGSLFNMAHFPDSGTLEL